MSKLDLVSLSKIPELPKPPERVVSLVPSMTESLFELGFGESVVGITDYCIYPAGALDNLPRLGGPKNADLDKIIDIKPDLVFGNQEENSRQLIKGLVDAGVNVWLTFPQTVNQAVDILRNLLAIYRTDDPVMLVNSLQMALDWASSASQNQTKVRYFCPIWQDETKGGEKWWMTFNQHTYTHDLLSTLGGENVFADRERRYPLAADLGEAKPEDRDEMDTRYPRVTQEEIESASPELILLPSEPFDFDESHLQTILELFAGSPAVKNGRVLFVDGSLITWHGTRLAKAVQELPSLFA
ncbi:MAG: ABC transporter substrate-binding protein [Chloroflexi bacterium]|nr:ABC transporter substrate-binding protein [Chloroflexota bacterium]